MNVTGTERSNLLLSEIEENLVMVFRDELSGLFDSSAFRSRYERRFEDYAMQYMKGWFGVDNGPFLLSRYRKGKASANVEKQIAMVLDEAEYRLRTKILVDSGTALDAIASAYRWAFAEDGMDGIDALISRLNARLKSQFVDIGLGPGAVALQGEHGSLESIAIVIADLESMQPMFLHWYCYR